MTENNKLIVQETQRSPSLLEMRPKAMVKNATEMADVLKDVIEQQGLSVSLGGSKPHVKAEGWATMGSMLGVLPREKEVKELDNGDYFASVELVNVNNGIVIGQGSSICGSDESNWRNKPRYARRSMAITRATGKAYRLGFSWIMGLAGYETCPSEEMPVIEKIEPVKQSGKSEELFTGTAEQEDVVKTYLNKNGIDDKYVPELIDELKGKTKESAKIHMVETVNFLKEYTNES